MQLTRQIVAKFGPIIKYLYDPTQPETIGVAAVLQHEAGGRWTVDNLNVFRYVCYIAIKRLPGTFIILSYRHTKVEPQLGRRDGLSVLQRWSINTARQLELAAMNSTN